MRTFMLVIAISFGLVGCSSGEHGNDPGSPAAPTNLTASLLGGGAHLTWQDNSMDETGFMVMRKAGAGSYQEITTVTFNITQFHDTGVTAGMTYTFQIMAMNDAGASESNEASFTP